MINLYRGIIAYVYTPQKKKVFSSPNPKVGLLNVCNGKDGGLMINLYRGMSDNVEIYSQPFFENIFDEVPVLFNSPTSNTSCKTSHKSSL